MTKKDKEVLDIIWMFCGVGGNSHKQWILDRIVRILSEDYDKWVEDYEKNANKWKKGRAEWDGD